MIASVCSPMEDVQASWRYGHLPIHLRGCKAGEFRSPMSQVENSSLWKAKNSRLSERFARFCHNRRFDPHPKSVDGRRVMIWLPSILTIEFRYEQTSASMLHRRNRRAF